MPVFERFFDRFFGRAGRAPFRPDRIWDASSTLSASETRPVAALLMRIKPSSLLNATAKVRLVGDVVAISTDSFAAEQVLPPGLREY